jgi:hypothetical protein
MQERTINAKAGDVLINLAIMRAVKILKPCEVKVIPEQVMYFTDQREAAIYGRGLRGKRGKKYTFLAEQIEALTKAEGVEA